MLTRRTLLQAALAAAAGKWIVPDGAWTRGGLDAPLKELEAVFPDGCKPSVDRVFPIGFAPIKPGFLSGFVFSTGQVNCSFLAHRVLIRERETGLVLAECPLAASHFVHPGDTVTVTMGDIEG